MRFLPLVVLLGLTLGCDGGDGAEAPMDPRCSTLCVDPEDDPMCDPGVARCELECNARVEGLSALCSACLLEGGGHSPIICLADPCCSPGAVFPNGVADCEASCAEDTGAMVREPEDPRCTARCDFEDPLGECGTERAECLVDCQARITGTEGLCATCLLEGASLSFPVCLPGNPCCPSGLEFRTSVEECAAVCAR